MNQVKLFWFLLPVLVGLDYLWLGVIAGGFYKRVLSSFKQTLNIPAASVVYLLMTLGIVLFVLPKASNQAWAAFLWGCLFGLILYGVYDFTNLAVLADWPVRMMIVDIVWGTLLCGGISMLGHFMSRFIS